MFLTFLFYFQEELYPLFQGCGSVEDIFIHSQKYPLVLLINIHENKCNEVSIFNQHSSAVVMFT
jgi:hypothetical protein